MKITDVRVINSNHVDSSTAFIEVETDEGITGIGATASPVPVISAVVQTGETSLKPLLVGEDPTDVNRLWHKMFESWQAQRGRGGELLGGAVQKEVMIYASTSRSDTRHILDLERGVWTYKTTEDMVNESFLKHMKESAFLIDLSGRTAIYNWQDLVESIEKHSIAGVCLQPSGHAPQLGMPPVYSGFWDHENVEVTPCRVTSSEMSQQEIDLVIGNLLRLENGDILLGLVDKQAGY